MSKHPTEGRAAAGIQAARPAAVPPRAEFRGRAARLGRADPPAPATDTKPAVELDRLDAELLSDRRVGFDAAGGRVRRPAGLRGRAALAHGHVEELFVEVR